MAAATASGGAKQSNKRKFKRNDDDDDDELQSVSDLVTSVSSCISSVYSFLRNHDLLLLPSHTLPLESSLSSSAISLSKLLSLLQINSHISSSLPPPQQVSIFTTTANSWFHRFLLSAYDDYDSRWLHIFRMSKPTFSLLLSTISPALQSSLPSIPPNYTLAAALYRLAHCASYASIARRFGLSSADACRAFYTVCKVICDQLGNLFEFRSDVEKTVVGFGWISLPNCCGVLGVEQFPVEGQLLGQNGYLSVQALVDSQGRFLDVSAGWPSTMKPDMALRQTKLFVCVEELKELLNGPPFALTDGNALPQYIFGASCFPLLPWLLTPYVRRNGKDDLSPVEMVFNDVHRQAMGFVGMAFGRVRACWGLLNRRWKEDCVEFLPFIIITGCLLHNFLIKHGEALPDQIVASMEEQGILVFDGEESESARRIRDVLALHLNRVSEKR